MVQHPPKQRYHGVYFNRMDSVEPSDMHEPVPLLEVDPVAVASNQIRNIPYGHTRTIPHQDYQLKNSQSQLTACNYALHVLSVDVDVIASTHRNSPSQSYLFPPPEITIN